ncbi:hypothetical protein GOBAR_AA10763 [Gossypium barbadense]|uniref:Uncharacterized protein n=1 Tax=Gossypium barbadense TaxID=3634 RepID=A0A2P5Y2Q5_GOSBA|nr:hypothetical protein GOBAR_AA10763 [Gossypium barbadense]
MLRVGDDTLTLQAHNSDNTSKIEGDHLNHSIKTNHMIQPTFQEISLKEVHELLSNNSKGSIHEARRLQIEEIDEWRTHKPRTHDKPKLRQDELDISPNQLKIGDKVLLDTADPHIVTTTLNEEIPLTIDTGVGEANEARRSRATWPCEPIRPRLVMTLLCCLSCYYHANVYHLICIPRILMPSSRGKKAAVPTSKKRKGASSSAGPTVEIRHPLLQFPHGPQEELFQILRAQPLIAGRYIDWAAVEQVQLADAIQALLTTNPWELFFGIIEPTYLELTMELCSTFHLQTVMTNYDDLSMVQFCLGGLVHQLSVPKFSTALAQESSLTLIGQMSPQGISSMLSMRMIERHQGTYLPQYHLAQSTEEEAYEDIPDDVPPQHEDPSTQPPPPFCPVHAAASYAEISECLN